MDADPTLRELVCDNLAHFAECEERIRSALFDKDRPGEVARDLIFIILRVQGSGRSTLASSIHLHIHGGMPAERREWQEFLLVFETSPAGATELEIIPTIMATDPSFQPVMAVLDTAIHALLFNSRRHHESESRLLGISSLCLPYASVS